MSDVVLVLSMVPDDESAEKLVRTLVEERLAACINVSSPMASTYWWQGRIERDVERQLTIKTTRASLRSLHARLLELHSYELPEFIVIDVHSGSRDYLAWVARETGVAHP
jgi:periplasmic divalent cation tolerance protein